MDTEAIITPFDYRELCDQLSKKVIDLENQLADKVTENGRNSGLLSVAKNNIRLFEDRLKDAILNEEIDTDLAQSFAEIFSFTLTQDVEVVFTVTFRGTASVPLNQIVDEIDWENEVSFDCNDYGSEIEFDLYEDGVDVEVSQ
jgi:type III secretion system FlhB-like substrate exporter